ncbi:Nuclear pore complex FG-nucleoporin component [Komagataella phaffii CBS 7435]|uniref:Nuclear pore complex FG-nucleoporin component n=1 Tax=Komagataella phaffii (strain ATCC 76273 / CBS 7435 / CECT 11047 / NRRL Y-11430 / Wegner 21-1) TaxID=981350 RepID=F2QNV3_KOMPC|nr:Nuclear pore complex FG-nucleoporin component [Komagataella phaffii CBS 7435]
MFNRSSSAGFGSNISSTSGTLSQQQPPTVPFKPFIEKAPNTGTLEYQSISCMPEYRNWSFEEIRLNDYQLNRRFATQNMSSGFSFGANANTQSANTSPFGQNKTGFGTNTSPFGATNTSNTGGGMFGSNMNANSSFGAANNNPTGAFGATNTSPFGSAANNTNTGGGIFGASSNTPFASTNTNTNTNAFGASSGFGGFGANNTNSSSTGAFGATNNASNTGGLFGQNKPAGGGIFGAPASTNTGFGATNTSNAFGTNTGGGGIFGQNKPAATQVVYLEQTAILLPILAEYLAKINHPVEFFGAQPTNTNTGFGASQNTGAFGATNNTGSGGMFGQSTQNNFTSGSGGGIFGASNVSNTGNSAFGASNNTGAFGSTGSTGGIFGQNKPAGGTFGNTGNTMGLGMNNTASNTNAFGAPSSNTPSAFGSNTGNTGGLFGQNNQTTNTATGGLFGQNQNQSNTGFGFGNKPAGTSTTGGLFGGANNATNTNTGGGLFGGGNTNANTNTGGSLFGGSNTNNQPSTGGGLFGASNTSNTGGGLFGAKPATNLGSSTGGGLFGNTNSSNTQGATGGLFGAKPAASTGGGLFGGTNTANNQPTGGGLFGNKPATGTTGGLFGGNTNQQSTGGGLFGNNTTSSNTGTGGSLFSSNNQQSGGGLFGNKPEQQFNAGNTNANANLGTAQTSYGSSSLFTQVATPSLTSGNQQNQPPPLPLAQPVKREKKKLSLVNAYKLTPKALFNASSQSRVSSRSTESASGSVNGSDKGTALVRETDQEILSSSIFAPPNDIKRLVIQRATDSRDSSNTANAPRHVDFTTSENQSLALLPKEDNDEKVPLQANDDIKQSVAETASEKDVTFDSKKTNGTKEDYVETEDSISEEYWTKPSLKELNTYPAGKLRKLEHFTVGRLGYGSIEFLKPVDLTSISSLEKIYTLIVFGNKTCVVYPEESIKPKVGEGFNLPAVITLENCFPLARDTRKPITDPMHQLTKRHIKKLNNIPGTKFISYDATTGTWVFQVEHM